VELLSGDWVKVGSEKSFEPQRAVDLPMCIGVAQHRFGFASTSIAFRWSGIAAKMPSVKSTRLEVLP